MTQKIHLVLDLDETLVYGVDPDIPSMPRPHVHDFLEFCFKNFESVNIWTAASEGWWNFNKHIHFRRYNFALVYTREKCSFGWDYSDAISRDPKYKTYKPLIKMWRSRGNPMTRYNTLIIDDDVFNSHKNYGNALYIPPFTGDAGDSVLLKMKAKLEIIVQLFQETQNIREINLKSFKF